MRSRTLIGLFAIGALGTACSAADLTAPTSKQVSIIVTSASPPAAGAMLPLEFSNSSRHTLGYNVCASGRLERLRAAKWVPSIESERVCTMELRLLAAGAQATALYRLPATLEAGTYRIVVYFSAESAGARAVKVATGTFELL